MSARNGSLSLMRSENKVANNKAASGTIYVNKAESSMDFSSKPISTICPARSALKMPR